MGRQDKAQSHFPREPSYKFLFTCNFPIHWGCRNGADGTCAAAALRAVMGEVQWLCAAVGHGLFCTTQAGGKRN